MTEPERPEVPASPRAHRWRPLPFEWSRPLRIYLAVVAALLVVPAVTLAPAAFLLMRAFRDGWGAYAVKAVLAIGLEAVAVLIFASVVRLLVALGTAPVLAVMILTSIIAPVLTVVAWIAVLAWAHVVLESLVAA